MSGRKDIRKVLVIGAGPIKIGQACEFDYSGTQACKALAQEGYEVVLVNSNPATIMTDPETAMRTYVEPLTAAVVERIIERERPQALLPTMGGQTALNLAVELAESGVLERYSVELIGAGVDSIKLAEERSLFRAKMVEIGMPVPKSLIVRSADELENATAQLTLPAIIRPAFTLGGRGSGTAFSSGELIELGLRGLSASPAHEILIEESVIGWKEIELEVVRDRLNNFIVVCSIENFDAMGVHTGDSITVAPLQTLSDKEYQRLRNAAAQIINAVGISCGGSNIQFAVNPANGDFVVIEMNPRVSRSSALASKATGYPIAKVAAKLAVGFTLDEIRNDIAADISACFEPVLDYVVTKIPRFNFDKFPGTSQSLGTQMKSVGEAMAVGATFQESIQKALRSLDLSLSGFSEIASRSTSDRQEWRKRLGTATRYRLTDIRGALACGLPRQEIASAASIDPWFVDNLGELVDIERQSIDQIKSKVARFPFKSLLDLVDVPFLFELKQCGFSDRQIACILNEALGDESTSEDDVLALRMSLNVMPSYRSIDTCAAEFPCQARYLYSTYTQSGESEENTGSSAPSGKKVIVLGSGPNRIGQGIEFDYCCVHASMALHDLGMHSIMVNCNPETVSTDYDVSDTLYFEPVTLEDVSNIALREGKPGIIIQFGGQTPLNVARQLEARGFTILGTTCESTEIAEDRARFGELLNHLGLKQPLGKAVISLQDALDVANQIGYPVLIRPSYVLGGRAMQVVHSPEQLAELLKGLFAVAPDSPVLINYFLTEAIEVDVDAIADGHSTVIAGVMEHVEKAGVHSGDSSCVMPPQSLPEKTIAQIREATFELARALKIVGLMNVQFAVKDDVVYVLEVNPRASRTVPFVCKATGIAWTKIATRVIMGEKLSSLEHLWRGVRMLHVAVKSVSIPFDRFAGGTVALGPEMRSTGEVMGVASDFALAFAKAQIAADREPPGRGPIFISASPSCQHEATEAAQAFQRLHLEVISWQNLSSVMSVVEAMNELKKVGTAAVISITAIDEPDAREQLIRQAAVAAGIPLIMTQSEALMMAEAAKALRSNALAVKSLQELHAHPADADGEPSSVKTGARAQSEMVNARGQYSG